MVTTYYYSTFIGIQSIYYMENRANRYMYHLKINNG